MLKRRSFSLTCSVITHKMHQHMPLHKSIGELIKSQAKYYQQKTYLYWKEAELSFTKLNTISNQVANNFIQSGLQKGDRVALLLRNCPEFIFSFFGCAKAGTVAVPIDVNLNEEEIVFILKDSGAKLLVCEFEQMDAIMDFRIKCPELENVYFTDCADATYTSFGDVYLSPVSIPKPAISNDDLISIVYTSGTEEKPKGVMLSHQNYLSKAASFTEAVVMTADDRIMCSQPLSHLNTQLICVLASLFCGASIILMTESQPENYTAALDKYKATMLHGSPAFFASLSLLDTTGQYNLSNFSKAVCTEGFLNADTCRKFESVFKARLLKGYGLTEATGLSTLSPLSFREDYNETEGVPLPGHEVMILDEARLEANSEEVGEIALKGACVMVGYYDDDTRTEAVTHKGWLLTGDVGYKNKEGFLHVMGRKSEIIIRGGEHIYPKKVEYVISKHPGVKEVAIVGLPDPTWGEEVVAFIVLQEHAAPEEESILDFCRNQLSDLKCPGQIKFLDSLPKTARGEIQRVKLKIRYGSPVVP
jgi:long-chain acyl-CoA synthetase